MARIRSIKPDFFRSEELQELEEANPGQYTMLTFAGLWTASDKQGVFVWKPKVLHLDILPFLTYDFAKTLSILEASGHIRRFTHDGREYGHIPTFRTHQRISGEEAKQQARYPSPVEADTAPPKAEAAKEEDGDKEEAGEKQGGSNKEEGSGPGNGVGSRDKGIGVCGMDSEATHVESFESPEPIQETPPPSSPEYPLFLYQNKVREAWNALGDKVIPAPDDVKFKMTTWRDLADPFRGIHSSAVLEAIRNYGSIVGDTTGRYYWNARMTITKWAKDHLERFLPANFRENDYRCRTRQEPQRDGEGISPDEAKRIIAEAMAGGKHEA